MDALALPKPINSKRAHVSTFENAHQHCEVRLSRVPASSNKIYRWSGRLHAATARNQPDHAEPAGELCFVHWPSLPIVSNRLISGWLSRIVPKLLK